MISPTGENTPKFQASGESESAHELNFAKECKN